MKLLIELRQSMRRTDKEGDYPAWYPWKHKWKTRIYKVRKTITQILQDSRLYQVAELVLIK